MDNVHDPVIRQCITSMALNNNILKHNPCDNFCVIKSDHPLGSQASKTVSLVLTRLQQPSNAHVHVLRCNVCGFLTLNPSSLKEHIRNNHPSSQGFWTYSCYQCSSMSTEKCLMEEHLKLYHRTNDISGGKLIERFHRPASIDLVQSPTTTAIPFTLTSTHTTPSTGFTLNFVNTSGATQIVNKSSAISGSLSPSATNVNTNVTLSPPGLDNSANDAIKKDNSVTSDQSVDDSVELKSEEPVSSTGSGDLSTTPTAVSGSRRRKATTPGRIRMSPSNERPNSNSDDQARPAASDESLVKSCDSPIEVDSDSGFCIATTTQKRSCMPPNQSDVDQPETDYPSPKRCRTADLPNTPTLARDSPTPVGVDTTNLSKTQAPPTLPFILSIGNSGTSTMTAAQASSAVTLCPQLPTVSSGSTIASNSPFFGHLIPLCGLPENILCGVSSALLSNNGATTNTSGLQGHSLMGNTLSLPVVDVQSPFSNPVSGSTWLLTSQSNSTFGTTMTGSQGGLNTLQPTVLVPIQTNLSAAAAAAENSSVGKGFTFQPADLNGLHSTATTATTTTTNAITNGLSSIRVSDVLEALKSFAAGGNLAASISLPLSGSNTPTTSTMTASNVGNLAASLFCTTPHLRSDTGIPTSVIVVSNNSSTPIGTTVTASNSTCATTATTTIGNLASATSNATSSSLASTSNVVSASGLLSQLALAAAAAAAAANSASSGQSTGVGTTESPSVVNGVTTTVLPTSNPAITLSGLPEQALDMSVRSGLVALNSLAPITNGALLGKSVEGASVPQLALALDSVDGKLTRADQVTVHGVMEALSAVLKGGLPKTQRLVPSTDGASGELTTSLAETGSTGTKTLALDTDNLPSSGILRPTTTGTHSILVPFPAMNTSTTSNLSEAPSDHESGRSGIVPTSTQTNPMLIAPTQSNMINLAQLQAIMVALTTGTPLSIPTHSTQSQNATASTTVTSTTAVDGTINGSPLTLAQTGQTQTVGSLVSQAAELSSNQALLSANSLLMSNPVPSSGSVSLGAGFDNTAGSALLLPTLNSLTSVCGLTLSSNPSSGLVSTTLSPCSTGLVTSTGSGAAQSLSSLSSNAFKGISLPSVDGLSFTNILSGAQSQTGQFNPTLIGNHPAFINLVTGNSRSPSQTSVSLSPAVAARLLTSLTGLTQSSAVSIASGVGSTTASATNTTATTSATVGPQTSQLSSTSLINGTLNVLDSSSQALLAAAAASGNVNQVALATLRGTGTTGLRSLTGATNGPVLGLLDHRTGLQFSVATTPSSLLASPELVNCLQRTSTTTGTSFSSHAPDDVPVGGTRVAVDTLASHETPTNGTENILVRNKQTEINSVSPYGANTVPDDEWESTTQTDESVAVQANLQSIYAGIKSDPTSCRSPLTNPISSKAITSPPNRSGGGSTRRHTGGSRSYPMSGTRRILNLSDDSGTHPGRPHRQNFTPTQNRILTEWYLTHKAKPYPSTDDTKELAAISGLSYPQVKKWFANKRARSTSSGLPKPTPPLAPDSSPDPTTAAAIVAAAIATAAGSAHSTARPVAIQPAYMIASQTLSSIPPSVSHSSVDVEDEEEAEFLMQSADAEEEEGSETHTDRLSPPLPHRASSCADDVGALMSTSTEDEELPLVVVSDTPVQMTICNTERVHELEREPSVVVDDEIDEERVNPALLTDTTNVNLFSVQPVNETSTGLPIGLRFTKVLQPSEPLESTAASPPTFEVPLKSSILVSPANGILSPKNSIEMQETSEESDIPNVLEVEHNGESKTEVNDDPITVPEIENTKGLRNRGVSQSMSVS